MTRGTLSPFLRRTSLARRVLVFAVVPILLVAGCSKTQPRTLAEGESAPYENGPVIKVPSGTVHSPANDDWITSMRVLEPKEGGPPYRPGQPISCVVEVQVPGEAPRPSLVTVEIKNGRVTHGSHQAERMSRIEGGAYRFELTFDEGVRKPGRYEVRGHATRVEFLDRPGKEPLDSIVRRLSSSPVSIEVKP